MAHEKIIEAAFDALSRDDGVIVVPTDTTYGLICRLDRPYAIERVYELKGRDRSKPLIILGSDPGCLLQWVTGDITIALHLASIFWPGPLTIVARATEKVPGGILAHGRTVGLRMPAHGATLALLSRLPRCSVASTSANLSGSVSPARYEEVVESVGSMVDFVMPDCDEPPAGTVSTIVDASGTRPEILRAGSLDPQVVLDAASEVARS